jgi:hypothetical protein
MLFGKSLEPHFYLITISKYSCDNPDQVLFFFYLRMTNLNIGRYQPTHQYIK